MTASTPGDLDRAVDELCENKDRWARLPGAERVPLLRRACDSTLACAEEQVRAACAAKGLEFDSPASAEEWLSGPMPVIRNIRLLSDTLESIERTGAPPVRASAVRRRPNGQLAIDVFPATAFERMMYPGTRAEVWVETSGTGGPVEPCRRAAGADARVALVLAAGNVAAIGPMDVLHKLFVDNRVVLLKTHPVNDYLGPFIERSLAPFIEAGCLRVVYGGAAEGAYLVHHPAVEEIHITGSAATHDAIVWGDTPGERAERKRAGSARVAKPITSELGCVTPVVIVPGKWSNRELTYHAENVATMIAVNASCNCNAAKVLVTCRGWPQRERFLARIEDVLATLAPRTAYYAGSADKYAAFLDAHPDAKPLAGAEPGVIPWTTIFDVDPDRSADIAFSQEAWCPIIAETSLAADDAAHFLDEAVRFANERLWGTLSCTVIAQEATQKRLGERFERAVADLHYGTVSVNHWSAFGFVIGVTPWGAAPGQTLSDIGSGIGMVHNPLFLDRPVKSVIRAPFTQSPKPPWFVTHRSAHHVARRVTAFEARPSWAKLPALVWLAMRP